MVAIAMIGNPPIILLDEPSTGMDPEARHDMWDVIQKISTTKKQASVIITTHSMDEAEALSKKIAILVEGEIKCIGNQQYLKDKFGKGYETDIKIKELSQEELDERISSVNKKSSFYTYYSNCKLFIRGFNYGTRYREYYSSIRRNRGNV